ncbi:MAG: hypothetical protein AUJ52_06700 [Elusimicrobia bacterium CG1_02_63_36]|nr:MAG: hypothetical protein AUJ52_06700 [Elusimicrobia bacterium CG1_02_63_36]PIP83323.1 MAG: mechanosensitive ion channel protein MscS [Elusimicrobia bacterium CG22_combo_CG10-13_8_21_14_all_63_91]PJA17974.1 MAG: mechanosensitive ion channel protein MscS [Elusimicrobia bacterium CG_4_10_14_0_2_um_filter_63_34]PJB26401.1 MAG: mechanosensitive ion channel protein MscS [Elusimicrobia bacterium CG_4_9_14_3_um_filter_62_55]
MPEGAAELASNLPLKIALSAAILGLVWAFLGAAVFLLERFAERGARYRFLKKAIPVLRIACWTVAAYAVIRFVFAPSKETFFAFTTASGVAIGFASQDILKNVFGGIMIVFDRPFQVGDKVRIGEYYGEVTNIGLRTTRLVTSDDNTITVPNAEMVSKAIANANSGALDCQVVTPVVLPPGTDIQKAKRIAWEAAATSRFVFLKKPISVLVEDAPSEKELRTKLKIKAYVLDTRYEFAFQSDVAETVKRTLEDSRERILPAA